MKRRQFNLVASASLGVFVVILWLWAMSYDCGIGSVTQRITSRQTLASRRGQIIHEWYAKPDTTLLYWKDNDWRYLGLNISLWPSLTLTRVPYWFLALLTAVGPIVRTVERIRTRQRVRFRSRRGLCVRCGYDLRASEGRCPECGTGIGALEEAKI